MVLMSLFQKDMEPETWLFTNPCSVTDTEQVKTGELVDGFYFWFIGYLYFVGLDMDKISVLCFQFPMNQKIFKELILNAHRCFEKDRQFLCLELSVWKLCCFPASFASGHENVWNLGILSSRDPRSPMRAGPNGWVVCPGATFHLWDGVYDRNMVRTAVEPGEDLPMERCSCWGGCNLQNTETQELVQTLNVLAEL